MQGPERLDVSFAPSLRYIAILRTQTSSVLRFREPSERPTFDRSVIMGLSMYARPGHSMSTVLIGSLPWNLVYVTVQHLVLNTM